MNETRTCKRCGAIVSEKASPEGLCPRCLLEVGLAGDSEAEVVHTGSGRGRPEPPAPDEIQPHFPQLEVLSVLGQGGMGVVYKARQKALGRECALKILTVDVEQDGSFEERFTREARTLAALSHPGLVTVYDFGQSGPYFYFVMELVDGVSLRQMLRSGRVQPSEGLSIVSQICDTLQYAHDEGVVHRDIKPENILVGRRGNVKILDFGLAKLMGVGGSERDNLTRTHQAMGTPHYMAPEQYERPLEVDHRADLYSLGVVFYELLTGELPVGRFPAPSRKVSVDVRLDEVVLKTLEKEPLQRYQHASQIKVDVDTIASGVAAGMAAAAVGAGSRPPPIPVPAGAGSAGDSAGELDTPRHGHRRRYRHGWPWILLILILILPCMGGVLVALFLGMGYEQAAYTPEPSAPVSAITDTGATVGPRVDDEVVALVDMDAEQRAKLDAVLARTYEVYKSHVRDHVQVTEGGGGRDDPTVLRVAPFNAEYNELIEIMGVQMSSVLTETGLRVIRDHMDVERFMPAIRQGLTMEFWWAAEGTVMARHVRRVLDGRESEVFGEVLPPEYEFWLELVQ